MTTKTLDDIAVVLDRLLNGFIVLAVLAIVVLSGYSILDSYLLYQGAHDSSLQVYKPSDDEVLTEDRLITENQIGWITIDNTDIDYPILQGKDNFEYLNKDPYGEFKLSGSIFLDYRNDASLNDTYSIIYGHHMEHNAMFGPLDQYLNRTFFEAHRNGTITSNDAVYDLNLFAVCEVKDNDRNVFNPISRKPDELVAYFRSNGLIYEEPQHKEHIVALATCSATEDTERLIEAGVLTKR